MKKPIKLAILISGSGTTMEAIIRACQTNRLKGIIPTVVVASRSDAKGIQKAVKLGIKNTFIIPALHLTQDQLAEQLLNILNYFQIDLVSQNGWLPKTPDKIVDEYCGRIINQHPGPLDNGRTDFGGKGMYGARVSCACLLYAWLRNAPFFTEATVHFVTKKYDQGNIIRTKLLQIAAFPQKLTIKKIVGSYSLREKLINETKKIQDQLLSLEHDNVIASLELFTNGGAPGFSRISPLIPKEEMELVKQAKKLAIDLFPYG